MKTEVFANDYVMVLDPVYPAHELRRHHLAGSDISQCCLFVWMGKKRFKNATYGLGFVLETDKKSPFPNKSGYVWRGPKLIRYWSVNTIISSVGALM